MNIIIKNTNSIKDVFQAFKDQFINYNWLITDLECNYIPDKRLKKRTIWISGNELFEILESYDDLQFIWAVFSAFSPDKNIETSNEASLPYADGNNNIWLPNQSPQHSEALLEVISWDSSDLIFTSNDAEYIKKFKSTFSNAVEI